MLPRVALLSMLAIPVSSTSAHAAPEAHPIGLKAPADGIIRVKSVYGFDETIARLKKDIEEKGIKFFLEVDQTKLAADAGIKLRPSRLLIFGNPALGSLFITSNPAAGIDWPVRLLVTQDADGAVWAVYTNFGYIARRHRIKDRPQVFAMATKVIASVTASVGKK